jgi:hypothetical protein
MYNTAHYIVGDKIMDCPICAIDPTSHSLKRLENLEDGTVVMYTKPAEATRYWDRDGILIHYDNSLSQISGNWIWIFDAEGFSTKHMFEIGVATSLARLISSKYSEHLRKIVITNPSPIVELVVIIVKPFLNKRMRSLLEY